MLNVEVKRTGLFLLATACVFALGCDKPAPIAARRPRIITFAPHITDIAFDMGLGDHVVGVTVHCICPAGKKVKAVGDGFRVNTEAILSQKPDILFYNTKDSNFDALRLADPALRLLRMRNDTLAALREGIAQMGRALGREDLSNRMLEQMDEQFDAIRKAVAGRPRPKVLFVMGVDHPAALGPGVLTDELLAIAGGDNAAAAVGLTNWSRINLETVVNLDPDVLICQVDKGADNVRTAQEYWSRLHDLKAVKTGRLYVIDDRRLTIPGSKVAQTARKLAELIHPQAFVSNSTNPKGVSP